MATMPHQMYGPPHGAPQHPGMYYQGGPQGMPGAGGPGGPQGPHGMPPGTPMGVAPQVSALIFSMFDFFSVTLFFLF